MFFDAQGQLRSLPATWTDVDPPDALTDAAAGQSFFRADDLLTLVALIGEIKSRHIRRRRRVKQIVPHV